MKKVLIAIMTLAITGMLAIIGIYLYSNTFYAKVNAISDEEYIAAAEKLHAAYTKETESKAAPDGEMILIGDANGKYPSDQPIGFHAVDLSGGNMSEADMKERIRSAKKLLSDYSSLIFNFKTSTPDYSEKVKEYFSDEGSASCREQGRIWKSFYDSNASSVYQDFTMKTAHFNKAGDRKFIEGTGYAEVSFKSDQIKEGTYYVVVRYTIDYNSKGMKFDEIIIDDIFEKTDSFKMCYVAGTSYGSVAVSGEYIDAFRF